MNDVETRSRQTALCAVAFAAFALASLPASAEKGGNSGNRGNHGGSNHSASAGHGNSGNNGRGAVASELAFLNSAHANQNALEHASPNSRPGQLYAYQQARIGVATAAEAAQAADAEYQRLLALTPEEIAIEFPDGGYEEALSIAASNALAADGLAAYAQTKVDESYMTLTGGRELSADAMAELDRLLGL